MEPLQCKIFFLLQKFTSSEDLIARIDEEAAMCGSLQEQNHWDIIPEALD